MAKKVNNVCTLASISFPLHYQLTVLFSIELENEEDVERVWMSLPDGTNYVDGYTIDGYTIVEKAE